jgi:hypothetical protein
MKRKTTCSSCGIKTVKYYIPKLDKKRVCPKCYIKLAFEIYVKYYL